LTWARQYPKGRLSRNTTPDMIPSFTLGSPSCDTIVQNRLDCTFGLRGAWPLVP
jgi:hypothetical protein